MGNCCIICRKPLESGIIIYGKVICSNCERRLIEASCDTDFYNYYKDSIKKNLYEPILRGVDKECQNYQL